MKPTTLLQPEQPGSAVDQPRPTTRMWMLIAVWLCLVSGSYLAMFGLAAQPGDITQKTPVWPAELNQYARPGKWALLMFVHPRCPCTRASLEELRKVVESTSRPVTVVIAFLTPPVGMDWQNSPLRMQAAKIPGAILVDDDGSPLATLLDARCSGMTYLFDPQQTLRYMGGLTGSRGHVGENPGQLTVSSLLSTPGSGETITDRPRKFSVFGCPLSEKTSTQTP